MNKKRKRRNDYRRQKKKQYAKKGVIEGVYRQHTDGVFGFIDTIQEDGEKKGYYVYGSKKGGAFDGDIVSANVKMYRGREEATILKIIKRAERIFVGKFEYGKTREYGFVYSSNSIIEMNIYIEKQYFGGAKAGENVGVKIINGNKKTPEGKVVYILGKDGRNNEVEKIILEMGRPMKFSDEVLLEIEKFDTLEIEDELKERRDLRKLFTFTIDGADSKDLDDALSIKKKTDGGYILYVHIADVAYFVETKTALGKDAYERGASVYLADRVLPMLPPQLSNDLCSLHPQTDKLTITCEMHLDRHGKTVFVDIYESVINSDIRLTYREVDEILGEENDQEKNVNKKKNIRNSKILLFGGVITKNLKSTLYLAHELKQKLWKRRIVRGSLDFHFSETKIVLDNAGKVLEIKQYPHYDSNKLIEVFMVLANESVGKKFRNIPFLYRVHEKPKKEDIEKLMNILEVFHIPFELEEGTTKEFANLLNLIRKNWSDDALFLQRIILRVLSKALYSPKNDGHFGLGLRYYSHFTSPIRRYPDLQIHRIIKEVIKNQKGKLEGKGKDTFLLSAEQTAFYEKSLKKVGEYTTAREIKSQELEWKVRDYFIVKFYEDKVGEEFHGMISGMIPKGIFVELADTAAEGLILMGRKGFFDMGLLERRNARGKETLRMGEMINVKLIKVDKILFRLEFEIL